MPRLGIYSAPRNANEIQSCLDALVIINLGQLKGGFAWPGLYRSGARYGEDDEKNGFEHWKTIREILEFPVSDCEDLACARAAELRFYGECGRAVVVSVNGQLHCVVKRESGRIEDPSARLGMLERDTKGNGIGAMKRLLPASLRARIRSRLRVVVTELAKQGLAAAASGGSAAPFMNAARSLLSRAAPMVASSPRSAAPAAALPADSAPENDNGDDEVSGPARRRARRARRARRRGLAPRAAAPAAAARSSSRPAPDPVEPEADEGYADEGDAEE